MQGNSIKSMQLRNGASMMRAMLLPTLPSWLRGLVPLGLAIVLGACEAGPQEYRLDGRTMGTVYRVLAYCEAPVPDIASRVDAVLRDANDHFSTFQGDSVLSRFNAAPPSDWVAVSAPVVEVGDGAHSV
jgi:FAD:protein FMN transferase